MRKLLLGLIAVLLFAGQVLAQKTIRGTVRDDKGNPLPNASVVVRGTSVGATTGTDGSYSLAVPASATALLFSSVGFEPTSVDIGTKTEVNASLRAAATDLENVIVTGYTTTQKKKFSGATVSVTAEDVRKQPFGSFDQALQGKASGVSVVANSGQPGANAVVRVRGNGSISGGNVPLYIMDGIEISAADFASMNQGDFDRIEILKDAVGTAMYGSRGANGVIVITTRRGRAGQLNLNYDMQLGYSQLPDDRLIVMNSAQKIDYELRRGNPYGWSAAEADSLRNVNFNWRDALFQTGVTQQHQLSASGGTANSRFYASLSYLDQEGIVQQTGLKRYTARVNVDNTIKNWRFGVSMQVGYSKIRGTDEATAYIGSPLNAIRWSNPYERAIDPNTGDYQQLGGVGVLTSGQPNAAMELFVNQRQTLQFKGVGSAYLEFHFPFLKGLYARTNWGGDFAQNEGSVYYDRTTYTGAQAAGGNGSLARSANRQFRYTGTTSLNYKQTFGDHEIDGGIFMEAVKTDFRAMGFTGYGLTNGFTNETGITAGNATNGYIPQVSGSGTQNGLQSYFALLNYGFKSKYYLTLVGRRDGSSRLGVDNRFQNFGSVGATWVVSDEGFLENAGKLDDLRLRASYGTTGNYISAAGDYGHLPQFGRISYNGANGWSLTQPGNLNYRWEVNRTINLGVDFAFFKRRLSGTIEAYDRRTNNLYFNQPVSQTTGFATIPGNSGTLSNKGIELSLRGDIIRTADFRWTVEGNITYNRNRVVSVPDDSIINGTTILAVGKPINTFYLVPYAGVNAANGNALYLTQAGTLTQTYSTADLRTFGTSDAPWFGGLSTTVMYKGFDLSAQVNFFLNRDVFNNDMINLANPSYLFDNMSIELLNEWQKPGDVTNIPRPTSAGGNAFQSNTTRFLEDGSFWRLRNVTLGYTVPTNVLTKLKIRSARIFVQGQNWWTKTNFRSFDPESSSPVLVGAQYPALVQTTVGVSLGF
ncbi:SusC/RagA family TonB-linked outer membrane protein [Terrimonas sp. NA20]|uniref:SusC/RagA family TonB-linked outer membrane protein n=1 Tax=Terrimonas ginsenosidimutans TaxID=2908004 RepID=A0ABS9KQ58_9BACT|nr:SusC/RagA family TonB-linked outer membrane protein [Terrimonas ginsenosidimutans]MCG2614463.1 SusC/RagA family TonB-linked outer membrane protein [Terrimonas ginsenosidimutans]